MLKTYKLIAIIDSGIGGISVLNQLIEKYHFGNYIYYADNFFMPYGNKNKNFVKSRMKAIIKQLKEQYGVDLIIVACNTASTSLLEEQLKDVQLMEFNTQKTYFATNLTKQNLKNNEVIADKTLASLIEKHINDKKALYKIIKQHSIKHQLNKYSEIILGCTHFELVKDMFEQINPNTKFYNNSSFTINNVQPCLDDTLSIKILVSRESQTYLNKINRLIKR